MLVPGTGSLEKQILYSRGEKKNENNNNNNNRSEHHELV